MGDDTQKRINEILERYLADGNPSPELIRKFREWFANDGHVAEKYTAFERLFRKSLVFASKPDKQVLQSYQKICEILGFPMEAPIRRWLFPQRVLLRAVAILMPLLFVAGMLYLSLRPERPFDLVALSDTVVMVAYADKQYLVLPDSSTVWVNGGTRIGYRDDFRTDRTLFLDGEVYLDVRKGAENPFTVRARNLTVTVRGTTFDIKAYSDSAIASVVLASGKLDVTLGRKTFEMEPHTELSLDTRSRSVMTRSITDRELPRWMGYLRFEDTPLLEALRQVETYFGVTVELPSDFWAGERVTAIFEERPTLDKVLYVLQKSSLRFTYQVAGDTVRIMNY